MLDRHPELVGKFTFLQIGAPSRTKIPEYQDLNSEVRRLAESINSKFKHVRIAPITLSLAQHSASEVYRYYGAADFCFVSALHDGMNLVAKEYVVAREDENGVLALSGFTGAAKELVDAILVNPYGVSACAEALYSAITMQRSERQKRMRVLRKMVAEFNVYRWAASFLVEMNEIINAKEHLGEGRKQRSAA